MGSAKGKFHLWAGQVGCWISAGNTRTLNSTHMCDCQKLGGGPKKLQLQTAELWSCCLWQVAGLSVAVVCFWLIIFFKHFYSKLLIGYLLRTFLTGYARWPISCFTYKDGHNPPLASLASRLRLKKSEKKRKTYSKKGTKSNVICVMLLFSSTRSTMLYHIENKLFENGSQPKMMSLLAGGRKYGTCRFKATTERQICCYTVC